MAIKTNTIENVPPMPNKTNNKIKKIYIWENIQLLTLALTIIGQVVIGAWFVVGQAIWLAANITSLIRDFALGRPIADKIKDAALTAITFGIIAAFYMGAY